MGKEGRRWEEGRSPEERKKERRKEREQHKKRNGWTKERIREKRSIHINSTNFWRRPMAQPIYSGRWEIDQSKHFRSLRPPIQRDDLKIFSLKINIKFKVRMVTFRHLDLLQAQIYLRLWPQKDWECRFLLAYLFFWQKSIIIRIKFGQ